MAIRGGWSGIPPDRVVAVVARLEDGRVQIGSGYLVTSHQVLTARHCTQDKGTGQAARLLTVVQWVQGMEAPVAISAANSDVAVLQVERRAPWVPEGSLPRQVFGVVDRSHTGVLADCQAVGFPLWQSSPREQQYNGAELHGTIRLTEEIESGLLVMRDAELSDVSIPAGVTASDPGGRSAWEGLSGALVFYRAIAIGIVIEHHVRQGRSAITILPVKRFALPEVGSDPQTAAVAAALGLPPARKVPVVRPRGSSHSRPDSRWEPGATRHRSQQSQLGAPPVSRADPSPTVAALPSDVTSFIGRDEELAELQDLVRESRLTTIVGIGGVGKTRIAIQAARLARESFADGVQVVRLDNVPNAAQLASDIARMLGLREQADKSAEQVIVNDLRTKEELLLLDTCDRFAEACGELATVLLSNCPLLTILCTSRRSLGVQGEVVWRIPPLSLPADLADLSPSTIHSSDAMALFTERAKSRDTSFGVAQDNVRLIANLCARLDGIPLAIELAASWVSALDLEEIHDLLNSRLRFFGSLNADSPRHRTLESTLDWSYNLLTDAQQILFQRLSVFAGSASIDLIRSVCSDDLITVDMIPYVVSELADRSLIQLRRVDAASRRYYMLDTIREYADVKLIESGTAKAVTRRHISSMCQLVEGTSGELAGPEQANVLMRLDYELDNIRLALGRSIESPQMREVALRIAYALTRFWEVRGYMSEGRRWLDQALKSDISSRENLASRAYLSLGTLAYRQSDYEESTRGYASALRLARISDDASVIANGMCGLGLISYRKGDLTDAARLFEEGLALARQASDRDCVAWALQNIGRIREQDGDLISAEELQEESLALREESGDLFSIARSLNELAIVLRQEGRKGEAAHLHRRSLEMRTRIGDLQGQAICMRDLARVLEEDDKLTASYWLLGSIEIERRVGDLRGVAVCIERLAHLCSTSGMHVEALWLLGGALGIRATTGSARESADSRMCDEIIETARERLGSSYTEDVISQGQANSVRNIIAYAYNFQSELSGVTGLLDTGASGWRKQAPNSCGLFDSLAFAL